MMKIIIKQIFCLACLLGLCSMAIAQYNYAENAPGKIQSLNSLQSIFKRADEIHLVKNRAASLKKCLADQLNAVFQTPAINPPKGFDTKTFFDIESKATLPYTNLQVNFYYLIKDGQSVRESLDGTSITFLGNNLEHLCHQQGNFSDDCYQLKIPEFFEAFPVTKITDDYIEINFEQYGYAHSIVPMPIRIVKRNNKPLFVPLTKKEFVQYLIDRKNFEISENQYHEKELQKEIAGSSAEINEPAFKSLKEELSTSISTAKTALQKARQQSEKQQQLLQSYQQVLKSMSASEADSPVRIDEDKPAKDGFYDLTQLVPPTDDKGVPLEKINPGYFDISPQAPAVQLIIVYTDASLFQQTDHKLNYLQAKTKSLFNNIDYHQLKISMN